MTDELTQLSRRRTRRLVAVLAAALLVPVGLAVGLLLLTHRGDPVRHPAAAATAASPAAAPAAAGGGGVVDQVRWTSVAGARIPVSATAGPHQVSGGLARGFSHDAAGAVMAAVHISVRLAPQAGPAVFQPTLQEQVVGPDADALGQHLAEDYQSARARLGLAYGAPAGRLYSTVRGYQVAMDSTDAATVRLLIEGPGSDGGSVLVATLTHVQWTGGDWALVAPAGGDWNTAASLVTDTTGYVRFPDGG